MYPNLEWSGLLFYKATGDIDDIPNMSFEAVDMVLQDIGTPGHTQFKNETDLIDIYDANPQFRTCRMGLIHSHNTMKTFFSPEDMDELNDNTEGVSYYLSLIVNNVFEPKSKIAFRRYTTVTGVSTHVMEHKFANKESERQVKTMDNFEKYYELLHADLECYIEESKWATTLARDLYRYKSQHPEVTPMLKEEQPMRSGKEGGPPYFISDRQLGFGFDAKKFRGEGYEAMDIELVDLYLGKVITASMLFRGTIKEAMNTVLEAKLVGVEEDMWEEQIRDSYEELFTQTTDQEILTSEDAINLLTMVVTRMKMFRWHEVGSKVYMIFSKELMMWTHEYGADKGNTSTP